VLAQAGIPLLRGTETGLRALSHFLRPKLGAPSSPSSPPADLDRWRLRLSQGILNDVEALDLLADFGIPIEPMHRVPNRATATALAREIGYPVALKAIGLLHKTEHGGLRLNLRNAEALAGAWRELRTLELPLALQHMSPPGLELTLGMVNDPQVGPVMMIGAGGTLVELVADRVFAVPPLDDAAAESLLRELRLYPLLAGYRGADRIDFEQLTGAVVAFSNLVHHLGDLLNSIDVNPLIVGPTGLAAVDAIVI
jgi:acyl-CoA synthetase (NDP forming)